MGNKLHCLFLTGIAVFAAFFLFSGINAPWTYYRDSNGHLQERISRNYERHGVLGLRLGPAAEVVPPELEPILKIKYENSFYFYQKGNVAYLLHHPPTLNLLLYASTRVFGIRPGAIRLPMALLVFATAALVYLMAARVFGRDVALAAVFFWMLSPVVLCFGRMLDYVPFCEFFIALGTWQYLRWRDRPDAKNLVLLAVFLWAGGLASWYAYFLPPVIFLHHLLTRRDRLSVHLFFAVAAAVCGALGMLAGYYVWVVGVDGLKELAGAFAVRGGRALEVGGTRIPIPLFSYLFLQLHRIQFFFTSVAGLLALGAMWAWWRRPKAGISREQGGFLLLVLAPAVLILLTFRQGAYVHGFHVYFLSIFISVAAGWALSGMLRARAIFKVASVLLMVLFVISLFNGYKKMSRHITFNKTADAFSEAIESVADEKTIVGQNLFDEPTMWWLGDGENRMIIQREATLEQIKGIIRNLPAGYRFVYMVYLSQPKDWNKESDKITSFLYRKYETRIVKNRVFSRRGIIVFDLSRSRKSIRLDESMFSLPHVYFPDASLLFVSKGSSETMIWNGTIYFNNNYFASRFLKYDYTLLFWLGGSDFLITYEPTHGMFPSRFWDNEAIGEKMQVKLDKYIARREYDILIALCSQETMRCLEPEVGDDTQTGSEIPWGNIGKLHIEQDEDENDCLAVFTEPTLSEIFALYNIEKLREFIKETDVGPYDVFDLYGAFRRNVVFSPEKVERASRWFDRSSLIEKMVPSAMQDFMAQQKFRLASHYMENKKYFSAAREYYGIVLHVSNSYEYALRAFGYFSEKSWGGFFADRYARRLLYMRPGDEATREIVMAQYRKTGRVGAGVKLLKEAEGNLAEATH